MRSDTHNVRLYLLEHLMHVPQVADLTHDGSDFVMAELQTGEKIILYLVESYMPLNEVRQILTRHTQMGWYTLLIFWSDMLLPRDGERFRAQDWMAALLPIYGNQLYAYDFFGKHIDIFPIHFEAQAGSRDYLIRHGTTVNFNALRFDEIHAANTLLDGIWRIGTFERVQARTEQQANAPIIGSTSMQVYYTLLGLPINADGEAVRAAYRQLARQFHPDINPAPDALAKMQQINEAYAVIMRYLEGQAE